MATAQQPLPTHWVIPEGRRRPVRRAGQFGGPLNYCGRMHDVCEDIVARREDEYYPPAVTELYAEKLRLRVEDVEFHLIDGGHRFPSKGNVLVEGWLGRILR